MASQTAPLSSYSLVLPTMVCIDVWEWTAYVTLVILAGLMSLPQEPFEAAIMDGAKPLQVFRDVTLPLLRPIIALVMLLRGIDAFKEFDKVFILTGGGPGTATELLSIYTWRINFRNWDFGYGSVVAFMVYLVVVIIRLRNQREVSSTFIVVLERYTRMLQDQGNLLILSGLEQHVVEQLEQTELIDLIGKDNVFPAQPQFAAASQQALARAEDWQAQQETDQVS
jgi:ABC-type Fe3+ transport system permease subunit